MEPCLFRHGKVRDAEQLPAGKRASMEPCLFRHGKGVIGWGYADPDTGASMEPCLFRHGKEIDIKKIAPLLEPLQWSHVFSDMVRSQSVRVTETGIVLQWSHVFSDMVRPFSENSPSSA